ncbi:MAG: ankyrin repeat domain-containing protein [Elusimicrobia bacterium]|nr:ankyrin repeat domain-containing protein [Elusimicrobiota bacterium]
MRGDLAMRTPRSLRLIGMLLDKGVPVNRTDPKSGDTLLHIAVQFRDAELARLLKSRGADPAAKHRRKGPTPIGMAEAGLKGRYAKAYRGLLEILREP